MKKPGNINFIRNWSASVKSNIQQNYNINELILIFRANFKINSINISYHRKKLQDEIQKVKEVVSKELSQLITINLQEEVGKAKEKTSKEISEVSMNFEN